MTHDPMCPHSDMTEWVECEDCDLIAKVRASEKAKWTHTCPDNNCCGQAPE